MISYARYSKYASTCAAALEGKLIYSPGARPRPLPAIRSSRMMDRTYMKGIHRARYLVTDL
jgi:hypothetical protein